MWIFQPNFIIGLSFLFLYAMFFYFYYTRNKLEMLYFSIAFLAMALWVFVGDYTKPLTLAMFSGAIWLGTLEILNGTLLPRNGRGIKWVAIAPFAASILFYKSSISLVVSIAFLLMAAIVMIIAHEKPVKASGMLVGILSLVLLLPTKISIYLIFAILVAFGYLMLSTSKKEILTFLSPVGEELQTNKSGLRICKEFPEIELDNAVVFSREPQNKEDWFWITKVEGKNTIDPNKLEKLVDIASKKLENGKIVIIDCLDYLILENGFEPVAKMLAYLRDVSILNNSKVICVGDLSWLSKKELAMLEKIMGDYHDQGC